MRRLAEIVEKSRTRGVRWLVARTRREFFLPETPIGRAAVDMMRSLAASVRRVRSAIGGPVKGDAGTDAVVLAYDLAIAPTTYDIVWALCAAEMARVRAGAERVDVVFVPVDGKMVRDEEPEYERVVDAAARRWRVTMLLAPLCRLLPRSAAIHMPTTRRDAARILRDYGDRIVPAGYDVAFPVAVDRREVLDRSKAGENALVFDAGAGAQRYARAWLDAAVGGRRIVTITVREYGYHPGRNSNLAAWAAFATSVPPDWCVVWIPDSETPRDGFAVGIVCQPATYNPLFRAALYELADANLGVSGGPISLCWFDAACAYAMVKVVTPGAPQAELATVVGLGHVPGESPPFATNSQIWIWEDDDPETLQRAFQRLRAAKDAAGESEGRARS